MDFTDDMILEVLKALKSREAEEENALNGELEKTEALYDEVNPIESIRRGRHFRSEPDEVSDAPTRAKHMKIAPERRLAVVEHLSKDDELLTMTRDYIVAATNQVVRKLERVS